MPSNINNTLYEFELIQKGITYIAGIDEAGRGPLAGPMVTAAVILNPEHILELNQIISTNNDVVLASPLKEYSQIDDSKKLTEKRRNELTPFIKKNAIAYSIQVVEHNIIDKKGIVTATQMSFFNSVNKLDIKAEHTLTDNFEIKSMKPLLQTNIPKGDSLSITIAAASILAKTHRDEIMIKYHEIYPHYGFNKHKGYGTKLHKEMLIKHGICDIHRKSFEPVKTLIRTL